MLTQHLREMKRDGLIVRTDLTERVRHVEYSLSNPRGHAALLLTEMLARWSIEFATQNLG